MKTNQMEMTETLANALMDALACVAISANGGCPVDENGEPNLTEDQIAQVDTYVANTFTSLLNQWEQATGKKWVITTEK